MAESRREKRAVEKFFRRNIFRIFEPPYKQFGLLILYEERSLRNIRQTKLWPPYDQPPESEITYPRRKDEYVNYIYMPFCYSDENPRGTHIEVLLLSKLKQLQRRYKKEYGSIPRHVILYSYYSPCDGCTPLIVDARKKVSRAAFTVLYTKEYNGWPLTKEELIEGDIRVQQVSEPI